MRDTSKWFSKEPCTRGPGFLAKKMKTAASHAWKTTHVVHVALLPCCDNGWRVCGSALVSDFTGHDVQDCA